MPNGTQQHYKMYKAKKQWLVVGLTGIALGAGLTLGTTARAATLTNENISGNTTAPASGTSETGGETPSSAASGAEGKTIQARSAAPEKSQAAPASSTATQEKAPAEQSKIAPGQPERTITDFADVSADALPSSVVTPPVQAYQINDEEILNRTRMYDSSLYAALPASRMAVAPDDTPAITTDSDFVISDHVITGYKGTATKITIPAKVNGEDVYQIGANAFNFADTGVKLTSVTFEPSGMWGIGTDAFAGNNLTDVVLTDNVTVIGAEAFANNGMKMLHLGARTTTISESAFEKNNLTEVIIPDSVTTIGKDAFAQNSLLATVKLGSQLTTIGDSAFEKDSLSSVTIPDSVKTIGVGAFQGNGLKSVTLGSHLITIGGSAFADNDLTSIEIPDQVEPENTNSEFTIGTGAFANNKQLSKLTIGKNIFSIGDQAFSGDAIVGQVTIPDTVKSIGDGAFENNQLTGLILGTTDAVTLDNIGKSAFAGNDLETLVIPDTVKSIGDGAFQANKLTNLNLGSADGSKLTTIGNSAFAGNQLKGKLSIPNAVTTIGSDAFGGDDTSQTNQLTTLTLGKHVKTIGDRAFRRNALAGTLTLPDSVTDIGTGAFEDNDLETVQFGSQVANLGNHAFVGNDLQRINSTTPIASFSGTPVDPNNPNGPQDPGDAFAAQKSLKDVTVKTTGGTALAVRAAIIEKLGLQNLPLGNLSFATQNGETLRYDAVNDVLTLPAGKTSGSLSLVLTSSDTGDQSEGNYGTQDLELNLVPEKTDPSTPVTPVNPDDPNKPVDPTTPTKPTKPGKPTTKPAKPTEPAKKPTAATKATSKGTPANQHHGTSQSLGTGNRRSLTTASARTTNKANQSSNRQTTAMLPQTSEQQSLWQWLGLLGLSLLSWLGLADRRRKN